MNVATDHVADIAVAGRPVAELRSGAGLAPTLSPRPYLHPVTTFGGVPVTDTVPDDHRWHLGVSVAVQDVGGSNLWGGRTYVRDLGYQELDDHGRVQIETWDTATGTGTFTWHDRHGAPILSEHRVIGAEPGPEQGWLLTVSFRLTNVTAAPVALGSPGTNGRERAGYGGFFWRLPPGTDIDVVAPDGHGEADVHGRPNPWLRWSQTTPSGDFTLVFVPGDAPTASDPWFVRVAGYPGVGSALAFEDEVVVEPERSVERSFVVLVVDGRPDVDESWWTPPHHGRSEGRS